MIHTVEDFGLVNKAEVDVFLVFSCFFCDPAEVGNLISVSSAFSKSTLNIWKFTVHVLLKPGLEDNFEHHFANMRDECGSDKTFLYILLVLILLVEDVCCGSGSGKSIYGLRRLARGHSPSPFCLCQKLSLSLFTVIQFSPHKSSE